MNGVVDADGEVELDELPPPAQATRTIGKTKMARFFKKTPLSMLRHFKLALNLIIIITIYLSPNKSVLSTGTLLIP